MNWLLDTYRKFWALRKGDSGDKWRFSLGLLVTVSVAVALFSPPGLAVIGGGILAYAAAAFVTWMLTICVAAAAKPFPKNEEPSEKTPSPIKAGAGVVAGNGQNAASTQTTNASSASLQKAFETETYEAADPLTHSVPNLKKRVKPEGRGRSHSASSCRELVRADRPDSSMTVGAGTPNDREYWARYKSAHVLKLTPTPGATPVEARDTPSPVPVG